MSEFLAEARVLVRPDATAFRAQLVAQLATATAGVIVPIKVTPVGVGTTAATTMGFARLTEVQNELKKKLDATAGAEAIAAQARKRGTAALLGAASGTERLNSALLGLRTAIGGSAVIGLGALALAAITAGKAIRGMVLVTAQFEQELNTFQAVAEATSEEMEAVSEAALRLGADVRLPAVSAADAAVAMTELARAGLSVEDALDAAEGVLQLATAAQISNAEASQIAANALNAFGLEGSQASEVADNLANAANAAQGSISDFGLAFQQSSAVARQVGLSLQDTTALLALLARNGLRGSDAGTSLRVSLIKLVAPTKKAQEVIDDLGITIRDAQGNVRPDVFAQFAEATANLSPRLRDAAAATVFGTDGLRALSIAGREGAAGLRLMQFEIDQQGTAAEVAAARTKGLAGEAQGLSSNMQTLGINIGQVTNPILTGFTSSLSAAVGGINSVAGAIRNAGGEVEKSAGPDSGFGRFFESTSRGLRDLGENTGLFRFRDSFRGATDGITKDGLNATQTLRALNSQMQVLQTARIGAQKGGLTDLAAQITVDIERIRTEIAKLEGDTARVGPAIAAPLRQAAAALRETIAQQSVLGRDTTRFTAALRTVNLAIGDYTRAAKLGVLATNSVASGFEQMDRNAQSAAFSVSALSTQVANLTRQSAGLGDELLRLQSEGGTPQQQIAVLQQDIQAQRGLIEEAKAGPAEGRASAIREARNKIIADQNQIDSLQVGLVSDAKSAAATAKASATEAQTARDEADQALLGSFDVGQTKARNALLIAASTAMLSDDIRARIDLRAIIQNQIETARKGIKDKVELAEYLRTRNRELLQINLEIEDLLGRRLLATAEKRIARGEDRAEAAALTETLNDDIRAQIVLRKIITKAINDLRAAGGATTAAIKEFIARRNAAKQSIADLRKDQRAQLVEGIQLNIEFFQITDNRSAEIRARENEIRAIQDQIDHEKRGTNEYKRLRNELATKRKELAELKKEKDKTNVFAAETFKFLQTQQGFAANLLGNLIPGFATGGLVGGTTSPGGGAGGLPTTNLGIDPATGRPFRESGSPGAQPTPASGLQAQAAFKTASPTYGQMATEVDVLKQVLRVLIEIQRGRAHPEAALQRAQVNSTMDFQGGV